MIYVQIKGGLGNQLFQYSVGYYLKQQLGADLCLDYSSAYIGKQLKKLKIKKDFSFREIELESFSIDPHEVQINTIGFFVDHIIQKVFDYKGFTGREIVPLIKENGLDCRDNNIGALKTAKKYNNVIITGYWQNINYINPFREDLIRQFKMSEDTGSEYDVYLEQIKSSASIGVHVRRGDFVKLGWAKGADFYKKAISAVIERIPKAKFFFFSDDQEWVRENLFNEENSVQVVIHEEHQTVKEFDLLRHCKHQIISESTFGWWSAYLNEYEDKEVYIPFDCRGDIWLEGWKRINYSV